MTVAKGDTIKVDYRGTLLDGTEFDSSAGRGPLEFVAGAGQMIKGFDEAVIGMKLGEEKKITLPPQEAYGYPKPELFQSVPLEVLRQNGIEPKVGLSLTTSTGQRGIITEISDSNAVINFNHELAGKTLVFYLKVMDIQKP
ncbi:MAG: peptidylprolyl isomerase [Candidatus Diapherotrites archaeon]|nr:peptidylprolyl isomerase [Candidatus Diapherotrites archaeon]